MTPAQVAVALGLAIVALGVVTGAAQVRGLRRLARRTHVPSDELKYLRGKHRRRLVNGAVLVAIGGMVAGAYLSGMEDAADRLGQPRAAPGEPKPPMTDGERNLLRFWGVYWIAVVVLVFVLVALALSDTLATRRYWLGIYRELRDAHQTGLRRDLAVYRQHKDQNRAGPGRLGPVGGDE
jgi:hypothetical protein